VDAARSFRCSNPSFKLFLDHGGKRAPRRKGFFAEVKDKPDFYIFYDGGGNAQLKAGVRGKAVHTIATCITISNRNVRT
jgi:hypothetical protein